MLRNEITFKEMIMEPYSKEDMVAVARSREFDELVTRVIERLIEGATKTEKVGIEVSAVSAHDVILVLANELSMSGKTDPLLAVTAHSYITSFLSDQAAKSRQNAMRSMMGQLLGAALEDGLSEELREAFESGKKAAGGKPNCDCPACRLAKGAKEN